jgi:hypothetical protein
MRDRLLGEADVATAAAKDAYSDRQRQAATGGAGQPGTIAAEAIEP